MSTKRLLAVVAILALLGTGCSKKKTEGAGPDEAPTTTLPATMPAPLTGLEVPSEVAVRAPVSVKVDNSPDGRPQSGLDRADVLFEEKVEGGVTRFIAVYHSQDSDLIGPIRSLRTTDPAIVSALGGVFAFSDGVAISLARLSGAPVKAVSESNTASAFNSPKGKRRPFATYSSTARLREEAPDDSSPPPPLSGFLDPGEAFAPTGVAPAARATVGYGGRTTAVFDFDPATSTWLRSTNGTAHVTADGTRLGFANVIIQVVPYKPVGYKDSSGTAVDEAKVEGSGDAVVLVGGQQVAARWTKASATAVTTYTDVAGQPLKLARGTTLVALPPTGAPVTVT